MKNCNHCGKELLDEAVICPHCGCSVAELTATQDNSKMITLIRAFMIVGCVLTSIYGFLVPLFWTLPMTLKLLKMLDNKEPISMAFKICTLLFVSVITGILLLCLDTQPKITPQQESTTNTEYTIQSDGMTQSQE